MSGRAQMTSEQLRGLMMHGEHLIEHIEERSGRLNRLGGAAVNVLLGVCLGMLAAYAHAIAAGYRFYSYGDASLLWPAP